MRLILLGVNKPKKETLERLEAVLEHMPRCDACGRAFLEEEDDGHDSAIQSPKTKTKRR